MILPLSLIIPIVVIVQLNSVYAALRECVNASSLTFDDDDNVAVEEALATCLKNIKDPSMTPMLKTGIPLDVNVTVYINNLISINEIENTATIDLFIAFNWFDQRLLMPDLYKELSKKNITIIELTPLIGADLITGDSFNLWKPAISYPEAISNDETDFYLRLSNPWNPSLGSLVSYLSHRVITLVQTDFNYKTYPDDKQVITFRFFPFIDGANRLRFKAGYMFSTTTKEFGTQPAGTLDVTYFYDPLGKRSIEQNPIWQYESMSMVIKEVTFHPFFAPRSTATVSITMVRISTGIVKRLALPMFLLTVLGATTFWSDLSERIGSTMTILLSVSALYIVVFASVPMIGYLTTFDEFVIMLFALLFICVNLHGFTIRMQHSEKLSKWPLRKFYIRSLELLGRTTILPITLALYLRSFPKSFDSGEYTFCWTLVGMFCGYVSLRELHSLKKCLNLCLEDIGSKANEKSDLSKIETLLLNLYLFQKCSINLKPIMDKIKDDAKVREVAKQEILKTHGVVLNGPDLEMRSVKSGMNPMKKNFDAKKNLDSDDEL